METSVIIVLIVALLIAWIAWLIFNYHMFNCKTENEASVKYYFNRYKSIRDCLRDLINQINDRLPGSNLKYTYDGDNDLIEGEIKH